jgi:hypothetical protein
MKIRTIFTSSAAILFLAALPAAYASISVHAPAHALFRGNGQRTIKTNLRNDTGAPLELKIGDVIAEIIPGMYSDSTLSIK